MRLSCRRHSLLVGRPTDGLLRAFQDLSGLSLRLPVFELHVVYHRLSIKVARGLLNPADQELWGDVLCQKRGAWANAYRVATYGATLNDSMVPISIEARARARSYKFCKFSQHSGVIPRVLLWPANACRQNPIG